MLELLSLTGEHQGSNYKLFEGFSISKDSSSDLSLSNIEDLRLVVETDANGGFLLKSVDGNTSILSGEEKLSELNLMPGVIFSIFEEGFCVQEVDTDSQEDEQTDISPITQLLKKAPSDKNKPAIDLIDESVSFRFVRGPLLKTSWKILVSPTNFGLKSLLYFFIDPSVQIEEDFLTLFKDTEGIKLKSLIPGLVSVNEEPIKDQKSIANGDLVEFGQTAFYIDLK